MAHDEDVAPVRRGDVLAAKYRVEDVIGVGGMGVVVSATHLELDQKVALKFLLPQAAKNEELVGRFIREAKASIRLKGQHVTKVLDVGRMEDGRAYIVMEFLEGRDLGAELKSSPAQMPIAQAVGWMLQACEGLSEAHALGIVHRDLKPGNLFVTRGIDQRPLVKVLDFGISKSINPNSSDMLSLTRTEMLLGSPLYMAPEQMRSSKYVDERSDIWALGAIAYEMLTKRVPFEAETLLDLCFKVAQEGCKAVAEVRPEVPAELSAVVMRCLEKEPENRWHDIGELALALEPFADPADRGSAGRTIAILSAGGERARARRSVPGRPPQPSLPIIPIVPIVKGTAPISGDGATEALAPSQRPNDLRSSQPNAPVLEIADSTASTVPASSAWGKTAPSAIGPKPSSAGRVMLGAGAGALVAVVAAWFLFQRAPATTTPSPVTTTVTTTSSALATPPSLPPSTAPVTTTTAGLVPAAPSASAEATPHVTAPVRPTTSVPRPKPSAGASAAPSAAPSAKPPVPHPDGDFIKERE